MQRFLRFAFAIVSSVAASSLLAADTIDPRDVKNGRVIPDEGYCDQPYVVVLPSGKWLCVLTTGAGKEGQVGQHVVSTTSADQGRTWSKPVDIEPADGPEASWATPLVTPGGRVYVFYDYNGDRVKELHGKPARADMLGWYCFRYTDDEGASWSTERYRLPMRETDCDRANDWQGGVQIFWGISKPITVGGSAMFAFTKLGKYILDNGEGWFYRSDNILTERDPAKLHWTLLPDGERGVRDEKFGSVQEEHNIVSLGGDDLYCIYRTTTGNPCQSYSRDGGRTWSTPKVATYSPGGRPIKHPRACPKLWKTSSGKYLLWYHNHGGHDFKGRNPAWIAGGVARDGMMYWSQPEILLYDDDPDVRMSYPDLIEQDGKCWITETQKTVARVHEIDGELLKGLWRQVSEDSSQAKAVTDAVVPRVPAPPEADKHKLASLQSGGGFSLELHLRVSSGETVGTLLEAGDVNSRGWRVSAVPGGRLRIELVDGQHRSEHTSDPGLLVPGDHHVVITVDGGPKVISYINEGVLKDGGPDRESGWARFDPNIGQVPGGFDVQESRTDAVEVVELRIHGRSLRNFEAIENFRATLARR